jgi:hypothetical protein
VVGDDEQGVAEGRVVPPPAVGVVIVLPSPLATAEHAFAEHGGPGMRMPTRKLSTCRAHLSSSPSPNGQSRDRFGPAMNPSTEIEMSRIVLDMFIASTRAPRRDVDRSMIASTVRLPSSIGRSEPCDLYVEVAHCLLAEGEEREANTRWVVPGWLREVGPGQMRRRTEGAEHVRRQRQVQHLLAGHPESSTASDRWPPTAMPRVPRPGVP